MKLIGFYRLPSMLTLNDLPALADSDRANSQIVIVVSEYGDIDKVFRPRAYCGGQFGAVTPRSVIDLGSPTDFDDLGLKRSSNTSRVRYYQPSKFVVS